MGYMRHHAIIVTSWKEILIAAAYEKANELGLLATNIKPGEINSYKSFLVVPDGSKEGWDTSNRFDDRRKEFKNWLKEQSYEDGSTSLEWVEVQFGDDNLETKVIDDSEAIRRIENAS